MPSPRRTLAAGLTRLLRWIHRLAARMAWRTHKASGRRTAPQPITRWPVRLAAQTGATACLFAVLPAWAAGAEPPLRVVTLAPHITEMMFAAGAGHTLVGTVSSSDYPEAARALTKVGDGAASVNAETLIRLKPDLVLAWQRSGAVNAVAPLLQGLDIPLEIVAPNRIDDIPAQIEALGTRLGTTEPARRAAAEQRETLRALRKQYAGRAPVSVFIEIGHTPLYAVGRDPLLNDALRTCGGINIFQDSRLAALPIGPEHILQKRPDVILVAATTPEQARQAKARWSALDLSAQTGTRVHGVDPDALFRPGPRLIAATAGLCRELDKARSQNAAPAAQTHPNALSFYINRSKSFTDGAPHRPHHRKASMPSSARTPNLL